MRKIILYIAVSLNNKIARNDGAVDWLDSIPNPDKLDFGYTEFYNSIDTTIMGYNTYKQIIDWGIDFPYPDKNNYVLTTKEDLPQDSNVKFIFENHIEHVKNLKTKNGKSIWLIGGSKVNTLLLKNNMIDEIMLYTMPIILPNGIDLFDGELPETKLMLENSKTFNNGVTEQHYVIEN